MIYIAGKVFETPEEAKEFVAKMAPGDTARSWFILAVDPGETTAPKGLATDIAKALGAIVREKS